MNLSFPDLCRRLLFVTGIVTTFLLAVFVVIQFVLPDLAPH